LRRKTARVGPRYRAVDRLFRRPGPAGGRCSAGNRRPPGCCAPPDTAKTRHMIGDAEFKRDEADPAIVLNVGRGPVIEEAALIRGPAKNKTIAGGITSTYSSTNHWPQDSALWGMENVLIIFPALQPTTHPTEPDWLDLEHAGGSSTNFLPSLSKGRSLEDRGSTKRFGLLTGFQAKRMGSGRGPGTHPAPLLPKVQRRELLALGAARLPTVKRWSARFDACRWTPRSLCWRGDTGGRR